MILSRIGENKFRFDKLLSTLYAVAAMQEFPPEKISVKSNAMLNVYRNEKWRFEKLKELDKPRS